ncbi:MAG: hypothetical protein K2Z81_05370 [Cyanobacteria bacterium]|nr:hypothetical protein [Cyanobacteriota bacterium]
MSNIENYDPHIFTEEEAARVQFEMDREYGVPCCAYPPGPVGNRVNLMHFKFEAEKRDEFGWYGTTRIELEKRWGLR